MRTFLTDQSKAPYKILPFVSWPIGYKIDRTLSTTCYLQMIRLKTAIETFPFVEFEPAKVAQNLLDYPLDFSVT